MVMLLKCYNQPARYPAYGPPPTIPVTKLRCPTKFTYTMTRSKHGPFALHVYFSTVRSTENEHMVTPLNMQQSPSSSSRISQNLQIPVQLWAYDLVFLTSSKASVHGGPTTPRLETSPNGHVPALRIFRSTIFKKT